MNSTRTSYKSMNGYHDDMSYGAHRKNNKQPVKIEDNEDIKKQVAALQSAGCQDIEYEQSWAGTAPFCSAHPADCYNFAPEGSHVFIKRNKHGDGQTCMSGNKVLCARAVCRSNDPEYDPNNKTWWVGTAPACAGSPCDCVSQSAGAVPWRQDSRGGGGATCVTGTKQLCLRPNNPSKAYINWANDAKKVCDANQKMTMDLISKGMDIVKDLSEKAAA